jgi:hypothetical protein
MEQVGDSLLPAVNKSCDLPVVSLQLMIMCIVWMSTTSSASFAF